MPEVIAIELFIVPSAHHHPAQLNYAFFFNVTGYTVIFFNSSTNSGLMEVYLNSRVGYTIHPNWYSVLFSSKNVAINVLP